MMRFLLKDGTKVDVEYPVFQWCLLLDSAHGKRNKVYIFGTSQGKRSLFDIVELDQKCKKVYWLNVITTLDAL